VPRKLRYFKRRATIACSAGRRRLIQMSDNEASAWRILGKRWTLPILKIVGSKQAVRFNEIKKALAGISSTMLCERLLELEREGLLAKNLYGSKIEYSLTSSARELEFILIKLDGWRDRHGRACQPVIANYQ
jgi:DNA-binding HxlR family transcriptional regulator